MLKMVDKRYLYMLAALIWGAPGISITIKGIGAYLDMPHAKLIWLLPITVVVTLFFFWIFRRISTHYIERISLLADRCRLYDTFPLKGWILILFMMGLGVALKLIPCVPKEFTASFYSGLGPMLVLVSLRFIVASRG
jgi:hypothetical protein